MDTMDRRLEDSYMRQKLWEALQPLIGEGPLRARLSHIVVPLTQLLAAGNAAGRHKEKIKALRDELEKTPTTVGDHILPRSHLSPKRAKQIASEILALFVDAEGGL
jgi:hypothetical protein